MGRARRGGRTRPVGWKPHVTSVTKSPSLQSRLWSQGWTCGRNPLSHSCSHSSTFLNPKMLNRKAACMGVFLSGWVLPGGGGEQPLPPTTTPFHTCARFRLWAEPQEGPHMTDGAGSQTGLQALRAALTSPGTLRPWRAGS